MTGSTPRRSRATRCWSSSGKNRSSTGHDVNRNRWPGVKRADVVESLVQLRRSARLHLGDQIFGDVVQEVRVQIELGAVARPCRRGRPGLLRADGDRVVPSILPIALDQMPVPAQAAGPGDEHGRCHLTRLRLRFSSVRDEGARSAGLVARRSAKRPTLGLRRGAGGRTARPLPPPRRRLHIA
jgi:hypothetical protein